MGKNWVSGSKRSIEELWAAVRERCRADKELGQSLWRLLSVVIGYGFCLLMVRMGASELLPVRSVAVIAVSHFAISIALIGSLLNHPSSRVRPVVAVLIDLGLFGVILAMSGPWIAPLFLLHLLIVTTYGLRFGPAHMVLAQTFGVASLLIMWTANAAWVGHGMLVVTWVLGLLLLPTYAVHMLRELGHRNRKLRRSALSASKLLAQASHDIRHPLHASSIFTARLGQTALDPVQGKLLGSLEQSLTSAGEMLQSYLDLSLVESGQLAARRQSVPVQAVFNELSLQFLGAAERAGVELRFVATLRVVETDRVMLRTILQNLVTNAIRHAPGTKLVVGCRLTQQGITIQVSDQGSRPCDRAEPPELPESPRNSGLGMSIVYGLSREMKLAVNQVPSRRGHHVRISGLTASDDRLDFKALYERHSAFRPLAGMKVLLVSANDTDRSDEELLFRSWGCDVFPARNLVDGGQSCDVAVIHIEQIDARVSTLLRRLKIPAIIITPATTTLPRRLPLTMINARQPVNPAQVRSMMMALR